jgi:hypothetical protein
MRTRIVVFNLLMAGAMLFSNQAVLAAPVQSNQGPKSAADPGDVTNTLGLPLISNGQGPTAFFRSGQTFLTWPEKQNLDGETYNIYRSDQPFSYQDITSQNMEAIARVGKGSAIFYANRYRSSTSSSATWYNRYVNRFVTVDNGWELPGNTGLLVWTLGTEDFGGASSGNGYYAITITPQSGSEVYSSAAYVGPIAEKVEAPTPVEITSVSGVSIGSGGHVYIQYMDLRNWNGTYSAPNSTNLYWGLSSTNVNFKNNLQYAYDYDVFVPTASMCGGTLPDYLPVFVWLHGRKAETKAGEGNYPHKYCAYTIYPFDNTDTWWYGFAKTNDFRGPTPGAGVLVPNYTEQRVLRMIYDLERNPPGPDVDTRKIYIAGQSMGGTGAMAMAQRYPNVFAAAYASQPITNFLTVQNSAGGDDWQADAAIKWGDISSQNKVEISAPNGWANHLLGNNGITKVWDWENLQVGATRSYNLGNNQALFGLGASLKDTVFWPDTQAVPAYTALDSSKSPWAGWLTGKSSGSPGHQWLYFNGLPTSASKANKTFSTDYTPFWNLKVLKNETVPGFSNMRSDNPGAQAAIPPSGDTTSDQFFNQSVMWSASWNAFDGAPTDTTGSWKMTFCAISLTNYNCGTSADVKVNITVRRPQNFVITPNAWYHWINNYRHNGAKYAEGDIQADANGVLTIPNFYIRGNSGSSTIVYTGNRLVITPK